MPSSRNLHYISVLTNICQDVTFSLIPIQFQKENGVYVVSRNKSKKRTALFVINFITLLSAAIQCVSSLIDYKNGNFILLLFRGYIFLMISCTASYGFGYYVRAKEFCCLLNCMVSSPQGFVTQNVHSLRRRDDLLLLLIIFTQLSLFIPFLIFIPIVDMYMALECLKYGNAYTIMFGNCENNMFGFIFPLCKIPTLFTAFIISATTAPIAFIPLKETIDNWNDFIRTLQHHYYDNCLFDYWTTALNYRRMQVFVILFNECLQTHFWPVLEFIGSMLSICLGYAFVVYIHLFGIPMKLAVVSVLATLLVVIIFVMDVGSQSLCLSVKSIRFMNHLLKQNESKWFRKFVKSSSPVALKIGCFHKMNRNRGPRLIRFILQRTFFLVLKSKDVRSHAFTL